MARHHEASPLQSAFIPVYLSLPSSPFICGCNNDGDDADLTRGEARLAPTITYTPLFTIHLRLSLFFVAPSRFICIHLRLSAVIFVYLRLQLFIP